MPGELSREQLDRQNAALSRSIELPLLNVAAPSPTGSPDFLTAHREAHRPPSALPLRSTKRAASGAMDSRDGIQKLLVAEQEAQAIVTAARQGTRATLGPPVVVLRPRPSRDAKKHTTHTPRPPLPITERRENGEDETGEGGGRRGDRGVPRPARGHLPEDARGGARPNPPSLRPSDPAGALIN